MSLWFQLITFKYFREQDSLRGFLGKRSCESIKIDSHADRWSFEDITKLLLYTCL